MGKNTLKRVHYSRKSALTNPSNVGYEGLHNLVMLLLVFSNFRIITHSISQYGILVDPRIAKNLWYPLFISYSHVLLVSVGVCLAILMIEKLFSKKCVNEYLFLAIELSLLTLMLVYPIWMMKNFKVTVVNTSICLCYMILIGLKLGSYIWVNYYLRRNYTVENDNGVTYPENLTIKDIMMFLMYPTLCYEPNFPRTESINKRRLFLWIVQLVTLVAIELGVIQQGIIPALVSKMKEIEGFPMLSTEMQNPSVIDFVEYIFYLAVPNMVSWLLFFYAIFHCWFNIIAEVTYFADRSFYQDWWNATSIFQFWRKWNMPVHRWLTRHVYMPLQSMGYTKLTSVVIVFALSAVFHEFVVSIPLGVTKYWAALAMLFQIPTHFLVEFIPSHFVKNMIFWLTLLVGQPFLFTMYFVEYLRRNAVDGLDIYSLFNL